MPLSFGGLGVTSSTTVRRWSAGSAPDGNCIGALLAAQGLPAPRWHRVWTEVGLRCIRQQAKPLAESGGGELWCGLLELALTESRSVRERIDQAEAKREARAREDEGCRRWRCFRCRPADSRIRRHDAAARVTRVRMMSSPGAIKRVKVGMGSGKGAGHFSLIPTSVQSGEHTCMGC
jgi:hypothetical protein